MLDSLLEVLRTIIPFSLLCLRYEIALPKSSLSIEKPTATQKRAFFFFANCNVGTLTALSHVRSFFSLPAVRLAVVECVILRVNGSH